MKRFFCLALLMSISLYLHSQSIDLQMRRLEYIQSLIEEKREQIEDTRAEIDDLNKDRENFEFQYSNLRSKIEDLTTREREVSQNLRSSQERLEQSQSQLEKVSDLWQQQIYLFYIMSQSDKRAKEKIIDKHYLPLMICQTKDRIDENRDLLAHLTKNVKESRASQQRLINEKNRENRNIDNHRSEISKLNSKIDQLSTEEQEIAREFASLQQSRQNLENLITQFQQEQGATQFSYEFTTGKLLWPIEGEVINNFGEEHNAHHNIILKNNGIDILTSEPSDVRAVDFGLVVFAEHYRNYGKLVIIDHQNGYFSLYANNSSLLVTKDEQVSIGDVIATAGRKNNSDNYMLHFELRRHSIPVDPLAYLE